jgi:hypothetical protein
MSNPNNDSRALTVVSPERKAIAQPGTRAILPAVREAMQDLIVAFPPNPGEQAADRVRLLKILARETSHFEQEIVSEALRDLLTSNPRNPFRPSPQDIVQRCRCVREEWSERVRQYYWLAMSEERPPRWCSQIVRKVLVEKLKDLFHAASLELEAKNLKHPSRYASLITDAEFTGWHVARAARAIGSRISEWPPDLLAEFGLLTGDAFDRVQRIVDTEEEAIAAAITRPEVAHARQLAMAANQTADGDRAHKAFLTIYLPVLREELSARALGEIGP